MSNYSGFSTSKTVVTTTASSLRSSCVTTTTTTTIKKLSINSNNYNQNTSSMITKQNKVSSPLLFPTSARPPINKSFQQIDAKSFNNTRNYGQTQTTFRSIAYPQANINAIPPVRSTASGLINSYSTKPPQLSSNNYAGVSSKLQSKPISSSKEEANYNKGFLSKVFGSDKSKIELSGNKKDVITQNTIASPAVVERRLKRGFSIIFNHFNFENNRQSQRLGTEQDVKILTKTFEKFKISVSCKTDYKLGDIIKEVKRLQTFNFGPYDCFILVILSHGSTNNMICAYDYDYNLNETIIDPIINVNKSLAGKPKIIIIQACKGSNKPLTLQIDGIGQSQIDKQIPVAIPVVLNLLFCFATYEGYVSFRNPKTGGIFIQKFCEILMKEGNSTPIMDIMQKVTNDISENQDAPQVPVLQSTMRKPFIFGKIGN